jgi:hypothetical protein
MSDNPFDVFAADFKAAIPTVDDKTTGNQAEPINIMAPAPTAPVPVMNAPAAPAMNQPPQQTQQPGMMNGGMGMMNNNQGMYGGGYQMNNGMQQAPYGGAAMGAPAPMGGPPAMGAPAPMGAPPAMGAPAPMGGPPAMGAPPAPMGAMTGGVATQGALVASAQPSNPYAMNMGGMPYGQQPPAQMAPSPYGAPPAGPPAGYGMPPSQFGAPSPYGAPPPGQQPAAAPPTEPSFSGAPAVVQPAPAGAAPQQFGAPVPQPDTAQQPPPVPPTEPEYAAPPSSDPFSGGMPAAPVASNDPFGVQPPPQQPPQQQQQQQQSNPWEEQPPQPNDALVQVPNQSSDPFGVFDSTPTVDTSSVATPAPTRHYTQAEIGQLADDPWDATPFGGSPTNAPSTPANAPAPGAGGGSLLGDDALVPVAEEQHKAGELPPGGEWYDARIFTPTLGVMFFKPQELTDSLFLQTERTLVDSLDDRPVVAFIVEGSSARAAGVELGHVLLKVNGIDVKNPKEASRLIKEGPRPLPLLFYVPDTSVVVAEGEHMVKYDTRETMAPNSAKDWKPKYVVIGGIIAQPWMMNMYRSKVSGNHCHPQCFFWPYINPIDLIFFFIQIV